MVGWDRLSFVALKLRWRMTRYALLAYGFEERAEEAGKSVHNHRWRSGTSNNCDTGVLVAGNANRSGHAAKA